jgi:hypothetical protein
VPETGRLPHRIYAAAGVVLCAGLPAVPSRHFFFIFFTNKLEKQPEIRYNIPGSL